MSNQVVLITGAASGIGWPNTQKRAAPGRFALDGVSL